MTRWAVDRNRFALVARRTGTLWTRLWVAGLVSCALLAAAPVASAQPFQHGFQGPQYPDDTGNDALTAEKPESKLWWNDGRWWASLWSSLGNAYHIWYLDLATQQWIDTGTEIDDRPDSKADVLWDEATDKLYVVSHLWTDIATIAPPGLRGELFRYSYSPGTHTYSLDAGFPVEVTEGSSEALVIAKDSTGQLWVAYVQDLQVMVNRTIGDDATWGTPFVLPVGTVADVSSDDLASVIAFDGKIGIMWSHQGFPSSARGMYFAAHPDTALDAEEWTFKRVYSFSQDDHISLKALQGDTAGQLFVVIKTSNSAKIVNLLVCDNTNDLCTENEWTEYPVYTSAEILAGNDPTRPILLIDTDNRNLYVFSRNRLTQSDRGIYYKKVGIDDLNPAAPGSAFPAGIGTQFIGATNNINDPSSTKQNLTEETGLVVLASDGSANRYYHGYLSLREAVEPVAAFRATPTSGFLPLQVEFTDLSTGPATTWGWDFGDGNTSDLRHPTHTYTLPGTYTVTLAVSNDLGEDVEEKFDFITVGELPPPGTGVTFEEAQSGGSSGLPTVATVQPMGSAEADLFLAAVTSRPYRPVTGVSGLGLTWTLVRAQCAGRNQTGIEVWKAQGATAGGVVTATLSAAANNAAIIVSAYSGEATVDPVGAVVSGNTVGVGGSCSGGTDSSIYSLPLTTTVPNAVVYGAAAMRNRNHTPGPGYTERHEIEQGLLGEVASAATEDQIFLTAGPVVVNGTFSNVVDWAVVGVEIRPAGVPGPVAAFSANVTAGEVPLQVAFTDQSIGAPTAWEWDFGDGGTSTEQNPTHTYTIPGTYTVTLNVSNDDGEDAEVKTDYITAETPFPTAAFSANVTNGAAPLAVTFTDLSTGPPSTWAWEFGDEGTSTLQHPVHIYLVPGTYSVRLTVTNDAGEDVEEKTGFITVGEPLPPGSGVNFEEAQGGGSSGLATVATAQALGPAVGDLFLAAIATRPYRPVTGVSGLGLTWSLVKAQCSGRNQTGIEVWKAQGATAGGAVTATLSASATTATIVVSAYSGEASVQPVGSVVSGNTNGANGACAGGIDSAAYSLGLTATVPNALVYGAATMRTKTHEPGLGYAERLEFSFGVGGNMVRTATEDLILISAGPVVVNGTFNGAVDWAMVGVEIRPGTAGSPGPIIGSFDPTSGAPGTNVTISGTNFSGATAVTFNGTPATEVEVASATTINTVVPAGATTGKIAVTTPGGTGQSAQNFSVTGSPPATEVTFDEAQMGGSSNSAVVGTAQPMGPAPGDLFLAAVTTKPYTAGTAVQGLGLTWTLVKAQCAARGQTGIEVWKAQGATSGGVVTATLSGPAANSAIVVSAYSGEAPVDPVGAVVSGNTLGENGACAGGIDSSAYSLNFATTVPNAVVYGVAAMRNKTHQPGSGYTERQEFTFGAIGTLTGNAVSAATEDQVFLTAGPVLLDGSFNGPVDWAVIGVEIRPAAVVDTPEIHGTPSLHDYGNVEVLETASQTFVIKNIGGVNLDVTATSLVGANSGEFSIDSGGGPFSLGPGETHEIAVDFNPTSVGLKNAALRLSSNDPTNSLFDIPILGAGITVAPPGSGIVTFEEAQSGTVSGSATVTTMQPMGPAEGDLFLAAVATRPFKPATGVSGLGLTWTLVKSQCAGRNQTGIELWKAQGTTSGGLVTATLSEAPTNAGILVSAYSGEAGVNPLGAVVSGNTNGLGGACAGGTDTAAYSLGLTTTAPNSLVYGVATMRNNSHTPGPGYTERHEFLFGVIGTLGGNAVSAATEDQLIVSPGPAVVSGAFSGTADWAVVGVEIRAPAAP